VAFPEEGAAEGAVTIFENISKRIRDKSTINFLVKMKAAQFEAALSNAAKQAWKMSADGKAKILVYNGLKYVSRLATTGEATVDIYRGEELVQKYRLLH
jgi:hypothetical protein